MVELSRLPGTAPLLRRMAMLTPRLPDMRRFFQAHAAEPFDLIHATNITLDFAILPAFDFARAHGIPFIATPFVHLGPPGDRAILRYYSMRHQIDLLRRSERVITMTGLEGDALAARGVARARMRRVGVGVNPAEVAGGDAARFRAEQRDRRAAGAVYRRDGVRQRRSPHGRGDAAAVGAGRKRYAGADRRAAGALHRVLRAAAGGR